jgi:TPR repeat protein
MRRLRSPALVLLYLLGATGASAQVSLTPPKTSPPQVTNTPEPKPKKTVPIRKQVKSSDKPDTGKPAEPNPEDAAKAVLTEGPDVDLVYGAYQTGFYKTAFNYATLRAEQKNDPSAMTMLGELYANGQGVKRDYAKAIDWYTKAAGLGDREAMYQLAMMRISGHGGSPDREEGAKWLAQAAKLGEPKAAYNLAMLYLDGQTFPQDFKRAAELLRQAADAGNDDAQYALASFYKEGRGVPKDLDKSVRLLQAAAVAGNVAAEVEYAIALYNGTGTMRNEAAAVLLLRKAARQGNAIAQNRLAHVLVAGKGAPMDKIEGLKWHLVAKTAGRGDLMLDDIYAHLSPEDQAKVKAAADKWLGVSSSP